MLIFWGLAGAIAVTMARTISQEHAPPAQRARVLSLLDHPGFDPMAIVSRVVPFEEAPEALLDPGIKVVLERT